MKKICMIILIISISLLADFSRDDSTQIVTDTSTGLEWQDDSNASSLTFTWQSAIDHCENLSIEGGGMRLPNFNELYYIADRSIDAPAMDSTFKNISLIPHSTYWSSTTYANDTDNAWVVYFYIGDNGVNYKYSSNYVRCVRARQ